MQLNQYPKLIVLLGICLSLFSAGTMAQSTGSLTGQVLDASQMPIPGAAVTLKGTTTGSVTDASGRYTISGIAPGTTTVQASFLGYVTATSSTKITAGARIVLNFVLTEDVKMLGEAVVVGYGTTQSRDLTGAVSAIPSKNFQQGNFATPEQMVVGKTPGVRITQNSGLPGGGSVIRIRGGSSLNA
ncbi:MAG: SusC/RagA family protein, partial [Bacteroidetes bacterium]|nr:SusC/RagA family protein [Bacteroidota bacterium]